MIQRPQSKQPLPENAKKVFEGVIFDVYQWEQKLFNDETTTFEKLTRPDTVIIIPVTKEGKILVSTEEQPGSGIYYGVFSGRVEKGEDIEEAAKRELMEESGYNCESIKLWQSVQPMPKIEWAIYTFIAYGCEKVEELNLDAGEKIESREISFDEFIKYATSDEFSEIDIKLEFFKALLDKAKMDELKQLFYPHG